MTYRRYGFEKIDFILLGWVILVIVVVGALQAELLQSRTILVQHATWAFLYMGGLRILDRLKVALTWRYVYRILAIMAMLPVTFLNLGPVIHHLHPTTHELQLLELDRWLFGMDPVLYMERWLHPVAVDFFAIAYFSYFTLAFIALPPLIVQRDVATIDRVLVGVMMTVFCSYICYFLVPARSPYVVADLPDFAAEFSYTVPITGWIIGDTIRNAIHSWDPVQMNAFPSAHTAVAVVFFLTLRKKRILFWILFINGVALIFSTFYLRYHYVIDVIAGSLLAVGAVAFANWFSDHPSVDGKVINPVKETE
ncbi:MAG: phosphatase PAP2 family protein [Deltaproteobacteria bacterium]|nr:phosphatase PAP2 family protein [Deltaproteobacteria bacterium]